MPASNHLGFDYVSASQAQKEVTVNTALRLIDALMNTGVIDKDLDTPPGSPNEGDVYIVAATGTGAWSGHDGDIAFYADSAWYFVDPAEGLTVWINDENALYTFDGSAWVFSASNIQNASLIGINTTADATNKLAVASAAILFTNIGNGCQVKVNKAASGDTASFLFQTNFNGFAEFGTTGDDDFHFKVSPDNFSTTYESFVIDKDTGNVDFKQNLTAHGGDATFSFEITVGQADVASAAQKTLITAATGDRWKITEIMLCGDGTNFADGGGDRDLAIQDASGTVTYSVIPTATLQALATGRWGSTDVPFPVSAADLITATTAGEDLVAAYSGGTTDFSTGSLTLIVTAKKVA